MRHNLLFRTDENARSCRALPGSFLWPLLLILALALAACVMPAPPAEPAAEEMQTLADKKVGLSSPIQVEILVEFSEFSIHSFDVHTHRGQITN